MVAGSDGTHGTRHPVHVPVLLDEVLEYLALTPGMVVVDGTVGAGGHARAIAAAIGPTGVLVGLDRDSEILDCAQAALLAAAKDAGGQARISLHHLPFSRMQEALAAAGCQGCDRVLLDLGVSSMQLDQRARGFSFMADGPLDMRMNAADGETAAAWLARVDETELARVLYEYGEERHSRRIARALVAARKVQPIVRTAQLAELVARAVPGPARGQRIHLATRTFQAIRIAVNDELGELERGLAAAAAVLRPGGRLCAISFHSLEDRQVKQFIRARMRAVTRKPVTATPAEVRQNPRARSAKLRCGEVTEEAVA